MQAFLRESLQILYYTYFKPSALQSRLNEAAPQREGNTTFRQLSLATQRVASARRFLLQCALWWLVGLLPFWWLTWGTIPWWGMVFISVGLLLVAWCAALYDLSLSLVSSLICGLLWGLKPDLWFEFRTGFASWLSWDTIGLVTANLVVCLLLGMEGAISATARGNKELASLLGGLAGGVASSVAFVVAGDAPLDVAAGVAFGVMGLVMSLVASLVAGSAAFDAVEDVIFGVAAVVTFGVVIGTISGVAFGVAIGKTLSLIVGLAVGIAFGVGIGVVFHVGIGTAGVLSGYLKAGQESVIEMDRLRMVIGSMVNAVFGAVFGALGSIATVGAANVATLRVEPALGLVLCLGTVISPRRSLRFSVGAAAAITGYFIQPQGWEVTGLALLLFLVGDFRLLLFLVWLSTVAVARWSLSGPKGANALVRRLPPFTDEIVWLPLFGLDKLLGSALEENVEQGQKAVNDVATSFRQGWAARAALLQWSSRIMTRYHTIDQIPTAPTEFTWLPDEPDKSLRGVVEVRHRLEQIAREVEAALSATSDYNQLRRLIQAQTSVNNLRQSFVALKDRASRRFIPVSEHWDRLISDEIARLSAEQEIKADIPNPYITGIPVQLDEEAIFAPRPDLVRAMENALTAAHGKPTLALYGPRRMGKTTFLLHLPRLLPDEIVPVFVDLQEAVQVSSLGGLYYNWAVSAFEAARNRRRQDLPRPELSRFSAEPAIAWREWLDDAEVALGGRKLFLTFDEFEWLVDAAEKNTAMEGAFSILRHLSQHRPRVYLLFAGAHRLEELAPGGRWHDYFINVRGLEVSYLAEPDARRLLTNPISDFPLDYAPGAVDETIRLTRCQPMLVQLIGSILVDWLNSPTRRQQGDWLIATMEDVAHVAREILREGQPYFANLWADAGEGGRQVLGAVAQAPDGLTLSELTQKTGLPAGDLPAVLTRLEQYRLVEQIGDRWRVQVELTRRAFARFARTA